MSPPSSRIDVLALQLWPCPLAPVALLGAAGPPTPFREGAKLLQPPRKNCPLPKIFGLGGRPEWLRTFAGRSARPIPPALLPREGRRLIKAVPEGGGPRAVPVDIVLVEAGKPAPVLMLPPGAFRYEVEDDPAYNVQ